MANLIITIIDKLLIKGDSSTSATLSLISCNFARSLRLLTPTAIGTVAAFPTFLDLLASTALLLRVLNAVDDVLTTTLILLVPISTTIE